MHPDCLLCTWACDWHWYSWLNLMVDFVGHCFGKHISQTIKAFNLELCVLQKVHRFAILILCLESISYLSNLYEYIPHYTNTRTFHIYILYKSQHQYTSLHRNLLINFNMKIGLLSISKKSINYIIWHSFSSFLFLSSTIAATFAGTISLFATSDKSTQST